jgi:hypothetical protein
MRLAMKCPICKTEIPASPGQAPSPHFPFCSERCKLIDLGRWLNGKYQIPVEPDEQVITPRVEEDEE